MKLLNNPQKMLQKQAEARRSLLRYGARLGGELFGPIPKGHRREFFCLDERTWIWHEEWTDLHTKKHHAVMTRYDVQPNGILKSQGTNSYQRLTPQEAKNFYQACELYYEKFGNEMSRISQGN